MPRVTANFVSQPQNETTVPLNPIFDFDTHLLNYLVTTTPEEYEYKNRNDRRKKKKEKGTVKLARL